MKLGSRYKVLGICLVAIVILGGAGCFFLHRLKKDSSGLSSKQGKINYEIKWQKQAYAGEYEGELLMGQPAGEGTFAASDGSLSYKGGWKSGKISGSGCFYYEDSSWEEGEYDAGKRNGFCRKYSSQDEYTECLYENDLPYGNVVVSRNGSIAEKTLLVNTHSVEELENEAVELNVKDIEEKTYIDRLVFIKGTVEFVCQKQEECYFRVLTENGLMVAVRYDNTSEAGLEQCVVPNIKKGDEVSVFGYYIGSFKISEKDDREYRGFNCLTLNPVYACLEEKLTAKDSYMEIKKDPYRYSGISVDENYIVEKWKRQGKEFYIFARSSSDDNRSHIFVLAYTGNVTDVFVSGQVIKVEGYHNGQYYNRIVEKENQNGELTNDDIQNQSQGVDGNLYPRIEVRRILPAL